MGVWGHAHLAMAGGQSWNAYCRAIQGNKPDDKKGEKFPESFAVSVINPDGFKSAEADSMRVACGAHLELTSEANLSKEFCDIERAWYRKSGGDAIFANACSSSRVWGNTGKRVNISLAAVSSKTVPIAAVEPVWQPGVSEVGV